MKLSLSHLREFVELHGLSPETIGNALTLHTAELEAIIENSIFFEKVVAGKLLKKRVHPNSDKLDIGTFDCGKFGKRQIVYGNVLDFSVEEVVPIALPGATLKSGLNITESKIQGEKSEGMLCINTELGMKNDGLLKLKPQDTGKLLTEISPFFRDSIFDIDNKSLTHRPDLLGHRGFALELSAIFGRKLTLPEPVLALPNTEGFPVVIQTDRCRRFCALEMKNLTIKTSHPNTQVLLENIDVRSISNLVDITNRIMMEFGQPMHAFDADKIEGKIIIRQAKKGETLVALDGEEYELTPEYIVVADEKKVLSIAGIMGGEASSVTLETTRVVLEVANFDPVSIRKTSQKLGLRSESSMRYEKSLDPENCRKSILAAAEMVLEICLESEVSCGLTDEYPHKAETQKIKLDPHHVRAHSGINISDQEIQQKLESIGFGVMAHEKQFEVTVPTNRSTKDIAIPEDLIEEVVRLYGFENIQAQLPAMPISPPQKNHLRALEWQIRDALAAQGFLEVYNYSFVREEDRNFTGEENYVSIENPLSEDYTHLRKTLISNFVKNIKTELRTHSEVHFFEFGHVYQEEGGVLPNEPLHLALFSAQIGGEENELFFQLKNQLLALFQILGVKGELFPCERPQAYFHPSKCADIMIDGDQIGSMAVLHPGKQPVKNAPIVFVELDAEKLLKNILTQDVKYQKISHFPSVYRDLSIVLSERVLMRELEKAAFKASPVLKKMELFDEYQDENKLGPNLKNLAFHLVFQDETKTLEETEIDRNFDRVVQALEKKFDAQLRLDFDQAKIEGEGDKLKLR